MCAGLGAYARAGVTSVGGADTPDFGDYRRVDIAAKT